MAEQTPDAVRQDNSAILWDIVQTFSEEAQTAATKKAVELGFDLDRGNIPFQETLINLGRNRDILIRAVEDNALPQLPLKIQNEIISQARKASTHLTALTNGTDSILPLETAVDDLTASVWYSNLQNMSGEILGFYEKLNQLKTLETTLREFSRRADSFKASEHTIKSQFERLEGALARTEDISNSALKAAEVANSASAGASETDQKAKAILASIQQAEKMVLEASANAKVASADTEATKKQMGAASQELDKVRADYEAVKENIASFRSEVEKSANQEREQHAAAYAAIEKRANDELNRVTGTATESTKLLTGTVNSTLETAVEKAKTDVSSLASELRTAETAREQRLTNQLKQSVTNFEDQAAKLSADYQKLSQEASKKSSEVIGNTEIEMMRLVRELDTLESAIREKIQLATNYQLFHAFQTRQIAISKGTTFWRYALFTIVGISFLTTIAFIWSLQFIHTYNAIFFLRLSISIPLIYAIHFCSTQYSKERQLEEEYAFKGNISISLDPYRQLVETMIDKTNAEEKTKYSDFVLASIEKVFTSPTQLVLGEHRTVEGASKTVESAGKTFKNDAKSVEEASKGIGSVLSSVKALIDSLAKFK